MAIVKDFMLGPTHIQIDDSKCVSKEEAEEILLKIAKRIQPHMCYIEGKRLRTVNENSKKETTDT